MLIKEIFTAEEMLQQLPLLQQLYPDMTKEKYETLLRDMIPHGYSQVVVLDGDKCVGLSGIWFNTKLWTGKYIELDNVVTDKNHRSKGVGKLINYFAAGKAKQLGCRYIVLDAFAENRDAHRFYFRDGYVIGGFHFLKNIPSP
jgi:GNAT superfamily N-acetyltransferase